LAQSGHWRDLGSMTAFGPKRTLEGDSRNRGISARRWNAWLILEGHRGAISILNRHALKESANGSYGGPKIEYQRIFTAAHQEHVAGFGVRA